MAALFPIRHGITLRRPIVAKTLWDVEGFEVGKSHLLQSSKCGANIRAMAPGAAAAIDDDLLIAGKAGNELLQGRKTFRFGSSADVL